MLNYSFDIDFRNFLRENNIVFSLYANSVYFFPNNKLKIVLISACQSSNGVSNAVSNEVSNAASNELSDAALLLSPREVLQDDTLQLSSQKLQEKIIDVLYLYEDRWRYFGDIIKRRILCRLGKFEHIFARKCFILRGEDFAKMCLNKETKAIEILENNFPREISDGFIKTLFLKIKNNYSFPLAYNKGVRVLSATAINVYNRLISDFLEVNHSYGSAKCKYRYALLYNNIIVAVSTFSDSIILKQNIFSYEWVRYASISNYRIIGGMGKLLNAFLVDRYSERKKSDDYSNRDYNDCNAADSGNSNNVGNYCNVSNVSKNGARDRDDSGGSSGSSGSKDSGDSSNSRDSNGFNIEVMTYSDNEWSNGSVYEKLGFIKVGDREPISYLVDKNTFKRYNMRQLGNNFNSANYYKISNMGSKKFILR